MVRFAVIVAAVLMLVLAAIWGFQRRLIYLPDAADAGSAATVLPGARDITLETDDGVRLGAWLVPATKADRGVAVLVAAGNAGNRATRAPLARALAAEGLTVLLFDYRGYGGTEGRPSEKGLARDVRAAQRHLVQEAGVPADRILYVGESLGAAVVTELATEIAPGGLVLRSPFVDLASVSQVHYPFLPVRLLLRDEYPLAEQLATVKVPVTVVLGAEDSIVPPDQSRAVAAAAPTLRDLVEVAGADHNDPALVHGKALTAAVVDLAEAVTAGS
ncbi:alpha/beta hydrolase [Kribbella sp. ALI-6-A]|uniref:alpha/beta hydrolase n=1 Tax=Kribbella sp. ALI-6-A TaxID=1933817 RepID=UPI00097BCF78|nr:alpha/beta hydrolase [Kribbella sp. ALI-6-A]ONI69710.1 alpha/beta hydrolase [Kribbella sp. ALI-6-A]